MQRSLRGFSASLAGGLSEVRGGPNFFARRGVSRAARRREREEGRRENPPAPFILCAPSYAGAGRAPARGHEPSGRAFFG